MNTKKRLNCYVFSNLMISFLTLNILTNTTTTELISKTSSNTLNKIFEKEKIVEAINTPDTIIGSDNGSNVITISNKVVQTPNTISYVKPSYNSVTGTNLVNYAKNYLGLRYVSAGNSLSTGTDCSGFTKLIYQEFGISLGRTVSSQIYSGTYVSKSDLQPGDLVFYSYGSVASHVAIYMGNGLIIHESNPRDGVKISTVNIMNYITARRLITSNVTSNIEENVITEAKEEVKSPEIPEASNNVVVEEKPEIKENETTIIQDTKEEVKTDDKVTQNEEISDTASVTEEVVDTKSVEDNALILESTTSTDNIIEDNN